VLDEKLVELADRINELSNRIGKLTDHIDVLIWIANFVLAENLAILAMIC
jgi:hypothetical protein